MFPNLIFDELSSKHYRLESEEAIEPNVLIV